jgi:DNA-binding response OmpR family regulator
MAGSIPFRFERVLVVEPIATVRAAMRDALKTIGIAGDQIVTARTLADAWRLLEVEPEIPSWIIVSHRGGEDLNPLQLLAVLAQDQSLRRARVSLFVERERQACLLPAYELGLMSHHWLGESSQDELARELRGLRDALEQARFDSCRTSAAYLRRLLQEGQLFDALLQLEKRLARLYAKEPAHLLRVAEAHFAKGERREGEQLLAQARHLAPELTDQAEGLYRRVFGDSAVPLLALTTLADVFHLHRALVVEPDAASHPALRTALGALGITDIAFETDGSRACAWLEANPEPGIVVHEWRVPGVSGIGIVQRIRQLGFHGVPIFVLSSQVDPEHRPLLREMGVAGVIPKPAKPDALVNTMLAALRRHHGVGSSRRHALEVQSLLERGELAAASAARDLLLAGADDLPLNEERLLHARFAYAEERYDAAHAIVTDLLQDDPDSLALHNLCGKILLKMGEHEAALMCFNRGQGLAPGNLERHCGIAEALADLGDVAAADQALVAARKIDPTSPKVVEVGAKIGLVAGDASRWQPLLARPDVPFELMAYMNNRAVAYARAGMHGHATDLYRQALGAIPVEAVGVRTTLLYNMALAHIRKGDLTAAAIVLVEAAGAGSERLSVKVALLAKRVHWSIQTGSAIALDGRGDPAPPKDVEPVVETDIVAAIAKLGIQPGSLCCHRLVDGLMQGATRDLLDSLKRLPPFSRRDSGRRAASGAARTK